MPASGGARTPREGRARLLGGARTPRGGARTPGRVARTPSGEGADV
jgi:hypothetical protein